MTFEKTILICLLAIGSIALVVQLTNPARITIVSLDKEGTVLPIPTNSSQVKLASFELATEGRRDWGSVKSLTVKRTGLGSRKDFECLWWTIDGIQKIGDAMSIPVGDSVKFVFKESMSMYARSTPQSKATVITLMGAMESNCSAGAWNQFSITAIEADLPITTQLPIDGPLTTTASQSVARVTFSATGKDGTIPRHEKAVEIGAFCLDVDSTNDQNILSPTIILRNVGSSRGMLLGKTSHMSLVVDGERQPSFYINPIADETGDTLRIPLGNKIKNGEHHDYRIVADNDGLEYPETIQFCLENARDLEATETGSGGGVRVVGESKGMVTDPAKHVMLHTYQAGP